MLWTCSVFGCLLESTFINYLVQKDYVNYLIGNWPHFGEVNGSIPIE